MYSEVFHENVDTKVKYHRWVRQYIGMIDVEGNKHVISLFGGIFIIKCFELF